VFLKIILDNDKGNLNVRGSWVLMGSQSNL